MTSVSLGYLCNNGGQIVFRRHASQHGYFDLPQINIHRKLLLVVAVRLVI